MVSIKKNGRHVANSPISIMVVQSEIGDASKVKVYGQGLMEGHTFEMADFVVDTRDAGKRLITSFSFFYVSMKTCCNCIFKSFIQCYLIITR